jgi:two-component SAPR family response regulator
MACFSIEQAHPFRGMRLLLVEDDYLIAQAIKRMLDRFGCEVVGPIPTLAEAKRIAEAEDVHGGLLDINIRGGTTSEVARMFEKRGTPFLFITGYASPPLEEEDLLARRRLLKPISENALRLAMLEEFVEAAG